MNVMGELFDVRRVSTLHNAARMKLDRSGFEPEAFPLQTGRYTRFNYRPIERDSRIRVSFTLS